MSQNKNPLNNNLKINLDPNLNQNSRNLNKELTLNSIDDPNIKKKLDQKLSNLREDTLLKDYNYFFNDQFNLYYFTISLLFFIILLFITPYIYKIILNIINKFYFSKLKIKKDFKRRRKKEISNLSIIYSKSTILIIYILFFSVIIKLSGLKSTVLVAFVGSLGATIALAAQGTLNNFISGILISTQNIYNVGEYIEINDLDGNGLNDKLLGQVIDFDFFTTVIRENDTNAIKSINNKILWNSTIANYNRSPHPRYFFSIYIAQNNNLDKIINIIKDVCLKSNHIFHSRHIKRNDYNSEISEEEANFEYNKKFSKKNVHITIENQNPGFCSLKVIIGVKINPKHFPRNIAELRREIILELTRNNIKINCLINVSNQ